MFSLHISAGGDDESFCEPSCKGLHQNCTKLNAVAQGNASPSFFRCFGEKSVGKILVKAQCSEMKMATDGQWNELPREALNLHH